MLPYLASGTTERWDNEETFTLNSDPTPAPPGKHGPVKISLSSPLLESRQSTTEDPILPLILKKLIEQSINNEIDQEGSGRENKLPKAPLVYMTPPPTPVPSSATPSSSEEDDDISTTTTSNSGEMDASSSTTTDSGEIDDLDATTAAPISKVDSEEEDDEKENKTPPQIKQYANKYQIYLPKTKPLPMEKAQENEDEEKATNVPQEPEEDDSTERYIQPHPTSNHLDGVEFPQHQVDKHPNGESQKQPQEESNTETIPENSEQDENAPTSSPVEPETMQRQRPTYYFFLRPRQTIPMSSMNNNIGMIPPQMRYYSPIQDSWRLYSQADLQQRVMSFPNPSYKFPSFIAQDYDNSMMSPIYRQQSFTPNYRPISNYNPINYQQQQQYLPMGSNLLPQYQYIPQPSFIYQNSYMPQNSMGQGQMYPGMSQASQYSPMIMPPGQMYRYPYFNNNYRDSFYQNNVISSPYSLNYDGNYKYPSPMPINTQDNYNVPRLYPSYNNNL